RRAEGVDVVAGLIETHGRKDTAAQIGDLPVLPRKQVPYRGQILEEFDLDAALARHPKLLLVDELAHTNAPGSRHAKRWEDVLEVLEAGIDVWATLNVQHLESLNDDVARITGIRPSETLPDRVLERADEIELIDLPPADLQARLREGKIYRAETARRALQGFFKEGNLAALRQIALRRAAARVDKDVQDWMRRSGVAGPWPTAERVIALIGRDEAAASVVRHAKRLADALQAPWLALHIERAEDLSAPVVATGSPLALAGQLGAEIEVQAVETTGLLATLLDLARARNATHLVIGRALLPWWRRLLRRSLSDALVRSAPEFALHIVPLPPTSPGRRRIVTRPPVSWVPWVGSVVVIAALTAIGVELRRILPTEAADMIYLASIVAIAVVWGTWPALLGTVLGLFAWDFFFIPPLYQVTIDSPRDVVTGCVFTAVAVLTGTLAGRVRAEMRAAAGRIEGLRRIGAFSRRLGQATTEPDLLAEIARQAAGVGSQSVVLTQEADSLALVAAEPPSAELDAGAWAAAQWAWSHGEPTGKGTSTLPSASWRFLPIRTARGQLGILGACPEGELGEPRSQALEALADQAGVALERVRLASEAARAAALEDTQRLRTTLLSSLGHDLQPPLTDIHSAASRLHCSWDDLPPESRGDLLTSIQQDVGRMERFLTNVAELTRLESGEVRPQIRPVPVIEVVDAAIARLPPTALIATGQIDPRLKVAADPALLEQALVHLLENALKYAPEGELVSVCAEEERNGVVISVADQGIGIPPEDLPHVFDSFFRVRRGDRPAGTGLGLAIARGLVEAMEGQIIAQSPRPDVPADGLPGTVVMIRLPRGAG
ncbi:MAG: sensor histidine kinase KdpD, partial [Acidobacteria bacterium]|nr:sensor histidine kinase KdpD [Acidobacteriota bacterium]